MSAPGLVLLLRTAGAVQLAIVAANAALPSRLRYRENLHQLPPIIRQVFIVHSIYILAVLVIFGLLCLMFAPGLSDGSPLGRFLSGALAVFWGSRAFVAALLFLFSVFAASALGTAR